MFLQESKETKKWARRIFYAYRMMIRHGQDNVMKRCRELCKQFKVKMYAKVDSRRLLFLRHNQQKLRAEEYFHLQDAIMSNVDTAEIGNSIILPS